MLILWERGKSRLQKSTSTAFQGESEFVGCELMRQNLQKWREGEDGARMREGAHAPSGLLTMSCVHTLVSPEQPIDSITCDPGPPRGQHRENFKEQKERRHTDSKLQ